ncbi:hypothetical protein CVT24_006030 [Panaeolus cyanescens]|uniref:Uncharacterized protein n=1 Tax=Panaeolus cyanescens TaxID=181874 RepID=A0A409YE22_9AGAR|nr:hypothetical protein CVT24_006030 [Panaeolus cyanescens]
MPLFEIPTQFRNFLNSAYQYLSPPQTPASTQQNLPSYSSSPISPHPHTPLSQRLHDACQSPTSTIAHLSPTSMRRELDITKHDLARANADTLRLEERCKMLERSLKDTRDLLRAKEAEIERLRRDRDRDRAVVQQAAAERALSMRRASDAQLQYTPQQSRTNSPSPTPHKGPRLASSLDTRMTSADLARQINGQRRLDDDPRSSSHSRSSTSSSSASHSSSTTSRSSVSTTRTPSPSVRTNGSRRPSPGPGGGYSTLMPPPPPPSSSLQGLNSIDEDRARLRSNETYMTRNDAWSGAQVLQAVHDINAEILQFAASATELCTFSSFSSSSPHSQPALNDTVSRLGTAMTQILATRDHSSDPLLVQLALQGAVNLCLSRALASFIPGFPSKSDALLTNIYSEMRRCEPQPTSARWAALTSGYVHRLYPTLMEYAVGELAETMVRWCADVFLVARCVSLGSSVGNSPSSSPKVPSVLSSHHSSTNTHQTILQSLRSSHLPALQHIARSALALSKLTREEIMSTTFQVVVVDPLVMSSASSPTTNGHAGGKSGGGGVWKEGEMTDAFAEYYPETPTHGASSQSKAQNMDRGRVVATIELGLRCVTRVAAPIPSSPDVDTHAAAQGGVPAALAAKLDASAAEWGLANGGWHGYANGAENGNAVNGFSNPQKNGGGSGLSVMNGGMQNTYNSSSSSSSSSSATVVQSSQHHQHPQPNGTQHTNNGTNSNITKSTPTTTTSMSGASTETTFETRLLLLPKVVLEGVVDVLDR